MEASQLEFNDIKGQNKKLKVENERLKQSNMELLEVLKNLSNSVLSDMPESDNVKTLRKAKELISKHTGE